MLYKVILAGGGGTRLAPLSTEEHPKQFITLIGEDSLLQTTYKRLQLKDENGKQSDDTIFVSSSTKYKEKILQQLSISEKNLILEPERKNTAPAIALIVKSLEAQGAQPDDLILISPADHVIQPQETFETYMQIGFECAKAGNIILFGIPPTTPETGYGYIKIAPSPQHCEPLATRQSPVYLIKSFKEKPTKEVAEEYLKEGNYLRNSGIFLFTLQTIKEAFHTYCPEIDQHIQGTLDEFLQYFHLLTPISIDYAIMEKTEKIQIVPMKNLEWIDIGDWERLKGFYTKYPEMKPKGISI
jgi:mannose-1-phosphate guanylyltransferase/mannose-6-phosphate isomerase